MPNHFPTILQPVAEILESISDAFFTLDREWRFHHLNRAAERLLRRSRDALLGRSLWDEFPEVVGLSFGREFRRAFEEQVPVSFEERFPLLEAWFEVRAHPSPSGLSAYFQDVSERRRMLEDLHHSEEQHRSHFGTMAQGVVFLDASGRIDYANPAAARLLGSPAEQLQGRGPDDTVWRAVREDGSDFPATDHPLMVALRTGEPVRGVVMGLIDTSSGEFRWLSVNAVPVFRARADGPYRVHCVFEDVTERRRSEEALHRSEQRYRSLVEATSSIVWATDDAGSIVAEVPSWGAFTGQTFAEYAGWGWLEAFHPHDRDRAARTWRRSLASGSPREDEYRLLHRDGEYRQVIARGVPVLDADKTVREWVGSCEDVTEQRKAEVSLRRAREEAERASGARDEFISILLHELRTPLTPALLTASMMEAHPDLPAEFREDVSVIRRNVELESRLIGDLLDLTRISKGKLELAAETVDLHDAIRRAVELSLREEAVRIVAEMNATRYLVRGDSARLQQVVWNLTNNAQKFAEEGGEVIVRTSDVGDRRVRVEVVDQGAGIDPVVLPRLFEAFEQGDARDRRSFAGLGLGLAISRKLVEAHGGTIRATSEGKGRGASFAVELPTIDDPSGEGAAPRLQHDPTGSKAARSILLVEDHDATRRIMARLLKKLGHLVTTASSVASALAVCAQRDFDLILSDLGLPDGSGLDLMRQLRAEYRGRAVALTGYGMESDIRASRDAGFADHLTKPVDLMTLQAAIARVLDTL